MTLIHLVRHAEVENPSNVWYGRLPGFVLSERGRRQSTALSAYFEGVQLAAVNSSPLERAVETARAIADGQSNTVEVGIDEDLIESETFLQGKPGDARLFRNPLNLRFFVNPFRPSWGETYASTRTRMLRAIHQIAKTHKGAEAVAVSHMTPILVARLTLEGNPRPAWGGRPPCRRASVTTLEFDDDRFVGTQYTDVGSATE